MSDITTRLISVVSTLRAHGAYEPAERIKEAIAEITQLRDRVAKLEQALREISECTATTRSPKASYEPVLVFCKQTARDALNLKSNHESF